jgi:microcin C transport system permease protein
MIWKILYLAIVLVAGWLLTTRALPWLAVRIGRMLGFRMRPTPITARRLARFRSIKRGYLSFLAITTLFVISLFLELIVNEKPLIVAFDGKVAMPAVTDWVAKPLFMFDISSFEKRADFGQAGESEVNYHLFEATVADPSLVDASLATAKEKMEKAARRFEGTAVPGADATEKARERYQSRRDILANRTEQYERLREAKAVYEAGDAWILQTLYPWSPSSHRDDIAERPPTQPSFADKCFLGTTTGGRDVLVQLVYGFRISITFALFVAAIGYFIGVIVGGLQGYYGGWVDIGSQRFVEIWGSIPFLFTIMIVASMITPTFWTLALLLVILRSWLGITFYVRGEFYREKSKDYVQAAIASGVSDWKIITKHILPNSIVPVVTFAPFGIVAYISSLVSLDYLGFGLPTGTPSWGDLLRQGLENVKHHPHLVTTPVVALAATLFAVVMIGEAVREAFDPKVFSRLR